MKSLVKVNAVSKQDYDNALALYKQTKAELEAAKLNLEYTTITAPVDGTIGRKNAEIGDRIITGQALLALVEQTPWVVANYKEVQIADIKIGQKVLIHIDAIPEKEFTGKVDSFSPASGSQFTLLPPDNASGNFIKIVQRVPVKIVFDEDSIKGYEDRIKTWSVCGAKVRVKE